MICHAASMAQYEASMALRTGVSTVLNVQSGQSDFSFLYFLS